MTDEKWENLIGTIEDKFRIVERKKENIIIDELSDGRKIFGKKDIIELKKNQEKMRLERIVKPRIIDKKTLYSKRAGSLTKVDYIYSEEDKIDEIKLYKFNQEKNNWEEIEFKL